MCMSVTMHSLARRRGSKKFVGVFPKLRKTVLTAKIVRMILMLVFSSSLVWIHFHSADWVGYHSDLRIFILSCVGRNRRALQSRLGGAAYLMARMFITFIVGLWTATIDGKIVVDIDAVPAKLVFSCFERNGSGRMLIPAGIFTVVP